jgi:HlyD family secretion protein
MAHNAQGLDRRPATKGGGPAVTPPLELERHRDEKSVPRSAKTIFVGFGLGIALLVAVWHWLPIPGHQSTTMGGDRSPEEKTFRIRSVPTIRQITLRGTVGAGRAVPVLMPFDGVIGDMKVQFGDHVNSGDILFILESNEIETRLRDARSGVLKAAMALEVLENWDTSPDVVHAKRSLEAAETSLAKLEHQVGETKVLFDRGIVSRNEYDSLVQQRDGQKLAVAGAEQDLNAALKRGAIDKRQVAELELENAKAKLVETQRQFDGATVRAPSSGILLRPPVQTTTSPTSAFVDTGARVQRGQVALMVADLASLIVSGKVDEIDINHVRIGQAVSITSDAFPALSLSGRIISASAEADQDASGRAPTFNVRAGVSSLNDDARSTIRIGMSASMTIDLNENPAAIVVPINSVQRQASGATVKIIDQKTGIAHEQPVTLGATTPTGIEITSGLTSGDVLLIP